MAPSLPKDPVVAWLSSLDVEAAHEKALGSIPEGASKWILRNGTFNDWLEGHSDSPVLWAHGLPGSGNTTCTAMVIDHLVRRFHDADSETAVAYVYCDTSNAELTAVTLLASVCRQLAVRALAAGCELPILLTKQYARLGPSDERPGIDEVMLVLMALCGSFDRVFLCVDALSEFPREDQRPLLLQKLLWLQGRGVRLFVSSATHGNLPQTCQCHGDIEAVMEEMEAAQVAVDAVAEDVRRAVIVRLRERHPSGEELLVDAGEDVDEIVNQIVGDSDRMFNIAFYELDRKLRNVAKLNTKGDPKNPGLAEPLLFYMLAEAEYVGKHSGQLSFCRGEFIAVTKADNEYQPEWEGVVRGIAGRFPKRLAKRVQNLDPSWRPDEMGDVYGIWRDTIAAIENHQSSSRDTAMTVLCWLAHAEGPVSLDDLVKALSWDVTQPPEYRIMWRERGIEIEGVDESIDRAARAETDFIFDVANGLLHFSKEKATISVLDSMKLSDSELAALFPGGHQMIAQACLQILIRGLDSGENTRPQSPAIGFLGSASYAERNWGHHAKLCKDDSIDELAVAFLTKRFESKPTWTEDRRLPFKGPYQVIITDDETPVLKAARLGLNGVLKRLLQPPSYDLNAVSYKMETAMSVAVEGGFISTVKLLYRHGASAEVMVEDYDSFDGSMSAESLLHIAARNNDDVMVALLIQLGLDRDITTLGDMRTTPLDSAIDYLCIDAVKMFMMHGAEITDWHRRKAIGSACLELVELIFERDDDSIAAMRDKDPGWKGEMLSIAARTRSIPTAAYVIRNFGASVSQLDNDGGSALFNAVHNHDFDMVKFLMENTNDPMIPFREDYERNSKHHGMTAIEAAWNYYDSNEPATPIVEYFLERMPPGVPSHVIQRIAAGALKNEDIGLAKRFINMTTGPLELAGLTCEESLIGMIVQKNNTEILSNLLDHGILAGFQDRDGMSPLHVAAKYNSKEAAELIIGRSVDIDMNTTTIYGMTPIHFAVYGGHTETLQVLLKHGADPSLRAEDGSSALVAAGCSTKLAVARALLDYNINVSESNLDGETILHYAVLDGDVELARRLVRAGIDTSISSRKGGTALHLAAYEGNADIVRILLDSGAQINAGYEFSGLGYKPSCQDEWSAPNLPWSTRGSYFPGRPKRWSKIQPGWTPLHYAALSGQKDIAGMLVSSGVNILSTGHLGETPLHVAASAADAATVQLLVEKGADVNTTTLTGETSLHWAARAAAAAEAKAQADSSQPFRQRRRDDQYEQMAPDSSQSNCVDLILRLGADATAKNQDGATPLVLAVAAGHGDAVETLFKATKPAISKSAAYAELLRDIAHQENASAAALEELSESFNEDAESQAAWCEVLGEACLAGKIQMAALAIYKGATLPKQTKDGRNPLHHIILQEFDDFVDLILSARCGADLDARDAQGRNALHVAAGHREEITHGISTLAVRLQSTRRAVITEALLTSGAKPNARTADGDTALHLAVESGDNRVVEMLLAYGASVDVRNKKGRTPLHAAVSRWVFPDIVAQLLRGGAHHSPRDVDGYTPLHLIRERRGVDALKFLVQAGADVSASARNGDQPLHRAVRRGDGAVVHGLLELGANATARGAKGRTCLHVAARYGRKSMFGELVTAGCELDEVDAMGWTAAHHAVVGGHAAALDALLHIGRERSVDVFGAAVGAVLLENILPRDEAERLQGMLRNAAKGGE